MVMCTKGAVKFYWEILPRSDVLKKRKKVGLAVDRERGYLHDKSRLSLSAQGVSNYNRIKLFQVERERERELHYIRIKLQYSQLAAHSIKLVCSLNKGRKLNKVYQLGI